MGSETRQDFTELEEQILSDETGFGKFKVFDYEASSGKTYHYSKAVVDYYHVSELKIIWGEARSIHNKSLIVIKTMEEGKHVAELINQFDNNQISDDKSYNKLAVAVNTDYKKEHIEISKMSRKEYVDFLHSIPVLIITQSEYLNICNNPSVGQEKYGDRQLLIVDEEIDVVFNSFNNLTMHDIARIRDVYLKGCTKSSETFQELTKEIENQLAGNIKQMKRIYISKNKEEIDKLIAKLHFQLISDITESKLKELQKCKEFEKEKNVDAIQKFIIEKSNLIMKFYNNNSVIKYGNNLHTYNPDIKLFTLKNNVWLDASASFNYIYQLATNTFIMANTSERLIDHSSCKLYFDVITKSTTSGKSNYVDLENDVLKYIEENIADEDKILVIDNLDECEKINDRIQLEEFPKIFGKKEYFNTINFQAMRGRNDWKEFNKIFILQQPQFLLVYYAFLYEYWSGVMLKDDEMHLGTYHDNDANETVFGFFLPSMKNNIHVEYSEEYMKHSKELELVRYTTQASSIYQGIKRIQRNQIPEGNMYVILHDNRMRKLIKDQLKNITVDYINFKPIPKAETEETIANKFIDLVHDMKPYELKDVKDLAKLLNTTPDYIYTMIRRNSALSEIINNRQIGIVNMSPAAWYLENANEDTVILISDFTRKFTYKWENFRRTKEYEIVRSRRRIKKSGEKLILGKRNL